MAQDAFVDVAYRGLDVGRRLKLRDVGPRTGYVEVGTPMPVGAPLTIQSDRGHSITAVVIRVHEQVAGADMPPGMRVRVDAIEGEAAGWWQTLICRDDPEIPEAERVIAPPEPAAIQAAVSSGEDSRSDMPQARDTAVMNVDEVAAAVADAEREAAAARGGNGEAPEARSSGRTMVMSAVEIEQITGLALGDQGDDPDAADAAGEADDPTASGELAAQGDKGEPSGSNGDELQGRGTGKRRRRRR
jgi:hypothetical protein